jgi:molybdenum cofactor cytidylyltransferase
LSDVEGVILAAGLSSRSGRFKMTLPLGDKTVIERTIESMYDLVQRVIVVVGWQAARLQVLLETYDKVDLVRNDRFRDGMFSSVKAGIARVRAPHFFLLPGDQPLVDARVYARLLAEPGDIVIPTWHGKRGHPVLFRAGLISEILAQPESATLRDYVEARGYVAVEVEDEGICLDLDTPEDYDALLARCQGGSM